MSLIASTSPFVGRTELLETLDDRRDAGARLVTLHGPPGVGKTRLAVEWLRRLSAERCRVATVTAAGSGDVATVAVAIADELGVDRRDAPADTMGRVLAAQGPLVLLADECETVADELAPVLARWLAEAPELTVLATSQVVFGLTEESCVDVLPLSRDEGVELLRQRASSSGVDLDDTPTDRLAELVARLDGLPLAIELAAGRLPVFSAPELLGQLDNRFRLLRARGPLTNRRHASLRGALEDSWAGLDDDERAVLSQLSVFAGSFCLAAATAVAEVGGDRWLPDLVDGLCRRSLLQAYTDRELDERRFRMLSCVRAFAGEHLDPAVAAVAARRHTAWYGAGARSWTEPGFGPRDRRESHRLAIEAADLARVRDADADPAAVAACALALDVLAAHRRGGAERIDGARHGSRAADVAGRDGLRAEARLARATALLASSRRDEAIGLAESAFDLATAAGEPALASVSAALAGRLSYYAGDHAAGFAWLDRALAAAADHPRARGHARIHRGHIEHWEHGPTEGATRFLEQGIHELRSTGDDYGVAFGEQCIAIALLDAGQLTEAAEHNQRAIDLQRTLDDRVGLKRALGTLGLICHERGDFDAAIDHYRDTVAVCRSVGAWFSTGLYTGYLGCVTYEAGDPAAALDILADSVDALRVADERRHQIMFARYAGFIAATAGRRLPAAVGELCDEPFDFGNDASIALAMDALLRLRELATRGAGPAAYGALRAALAADHPDLIGAGHPPRSWELRHVLRLLDRAEAAAPPPPKASVDPAGGWFVTRDGERVELSSQPLLARILGCLAHARAAGGRPVPARDLIDAGWPGEQIQAEAASSRLHTAIRRLRRLGLGDDLKSNRDGYWLA